MSLQNPLSGAGIVLQTPIADPKTGALRREWEQFFLDLKARIAPAINQQGQIVGVVAPIAQVNLSALLQGGATNGQVLEWNGTAWAPASLPPSVPSVDGISSAVTLVAGSNVTITDNSPTAGHIKFDVAAGAGGVSSLDSITGAVSLVAGSGITVTDNSPSAGKITIAAGAGAYLKGTVTINAGGALSGTFNNTGTVTGATTSMAAVASSSDLASTAQTVSIIADVSAANTVRVQVTLPNIGVNWNIITFAVVVFP